MSGYAMSLLGGLQNQVVCQMFDTNFSSKILGIIENVTFKLILISHIEYE